MTNKNPVMDITTVGLETRFGTPEGDKNHYSVIEDSNRPGSIRAQVRYLAAQQIDPNKPDDIKKLLGKRSTVAQAIAAKALKKALEGEAGSIQYATDNVDGKLAETHQNVNMTLEQLVMQSYKQPQPAIEHKAAEEVGIQPALDSVPVE